MSLSKERTGQALLVHCSKSISSVCLEQPVTRCGNRLAMSDTSRAQGRVAWRGIYVLLGTCPKILPISRENDSHPFSAWPNLF